MVNTPADDEVVIRIHPTTGRPSVLNPDWRLCQCSVSCRIAKGVAKERYFFVKPRKETIWLVLPKNLALRGTVVRQHVGGSKKTKEDCFGGNYDYAPTVESYRVLKVKNPNKIVGFGLV